MAMQGASNPAYDVSRLGQDNFKSTAWQLFMKLYAGEVLTAFDEKNIMMPLMRTRSISNGKSASFPMLGRATAEYLKPGNEITGGKVRAGERTVTIDDKLISSTFIYDLDEAMNHYETRSEYSKQMGNALAREADAKIFITAIKAALTTDKAHAVELVQQYTEFEEEDFTNNVAVGTKAADILDPTQLAQSIFKAKKELVKKDVPHDNAFVVLAPDQYFALMDVTDGNKLVYMNRDFGGNGSVASATVANIAGMPIYMSNHLVVGDLIETGSVGTKGQAKSNRPLDSTVGSGRTAAYDIPNKAVGGKNLVDQAAKVRGLVLTPDAVATVKLLDLGLEAKYQMERQGTLMLAKYAMGHNVLQPASAIALSEV